LQCDACREGNALVAHTFKGYSKEGLSKEAGVTMTNNQAFRKLIRKHLQKPSHLESVLWQLQQERMKLAVDAVEKYKHSHLRIPGSRLPAKSVDKPANHFEAPYELIRMNTAPSNFRTLIELLADTGSKAESFMSSKECISNRIRFLGDEAKLNMIMYMIAKNFPVSRIPQIIIT
jgi:hypothetical protein